ncbi:MAG: hypothetical protein HFF84_06975 [Oscillibacter sp.]|nr:hypothetical protein [Oscillibacter sp.]
MDEKKRPDRKDLNAIERFYEHFRGVPVKYLDIFIGVCVAALVIVLVMGMINR